MIPLLLSIGVALMVSLFGTPLLVRFLESRQLGQFIRQDGPQSHFIKRGTPTMGGLMIILGVVLGYAAGCFWMFARSGRVPKASGVLLICLMVAMGAIGFIDDFMKIHQRQNLGLTAGKKFTLQILVATIFAVASINFASPTSGRTPASMAVSFILDTPLNFKTLGDLTVPILGVILFIIFINFVIAAWTNAVNLTDGLDGLATGCSLFAFAGYVVICFWQFLHDCSHNLPAWQVCYQVRDAWDLALFAGAVAGACFGFLWWNASPAKIFMGDTGSMALGAAFAGLSILSRTELLALVIGGVFVMETVSVTLQVGYFKLTKGKRIFKMAPIHHHFELLGWKEVNVTIRFWLLAGLLMASALGIFYGGWVVGLEF